MGSRKKAEDGSAEGGVSAKLIHGRHDVLINGGELFGVGPVAIDVDVGEECLLLRIHGPGFPAEPIQLSKENARLLKDHLAIKAKSLS